MGNKMGLKAALVWLIPIIAVTVIVLVNSRKERESINEHNAKMIASRYTDNFEYTGMENDSDVTKRFCFRDTELGFDFAISANVSECTYEFCTWDWTYCEILEERCRASLDKLCVPHRAEWKMQANCGNIRIHEQKENCYYVSLELDDSTYEDERRKLEGFYKSIWEAVMAQDTENAIDELIVYVDVKNAGHAEGGVYTREIGYEEYREYVKRVEND